MDGICIHYYTSALIKITYFHFPIIELHFKLQFLALEWNVFTNNHVFKTNKKSKVDNILWNIICIIRKCFALFYVLVSEKKYNITQNFCTFTIKIDFLNA